MYASCSQAIRRFFFCFFSSIKRMSWSHLLEKGVGGSRFIDGDRQAILIYQSACGKHVWLKFVKACFSIRFSPAICFAGHHDRRTCQHTRLLRSLGAREHCSWTRPSWPVLLFEKSGRTIRSPRRVSSGKTNLPLAGVATQRLAGCSSIFRLGSYQTTECPRRTPVPIRSSDCSFVLAGHFEC